MSYLKKNNRFQPGCSGSLYFNPVNFGKVSLVFDNYSTVEGASVVSAQYNGTIPNGNIIAFGGQVIGYLKNNTDIYIPEESFPYMQAEGGNILTRYLNNYDYLYSFRPNYDYFYTLKRDITNEQFSAANYDTYVYLNYNAIYENSVTVSAVDDGTVYTENVDYEIDYVNGAISILSGGGMLTGIIYRIDYTAGKYGTGYTKYPETCITGVRIKDYSEITQRKTFGFHRSQFDVLTEYHATLEIPAETDKIKIDQMINSEAVIFVSDDRDTNVLAPPDGWKFDKPKGGGSINPIGRKVSIKTNTTKYGLRRGYQLFDVILEG